MAQNSSRAAPETNLQRTGAVLFGRSIFRLREGIVVHLQRIMYPIHTDFGHARKSPFSGFFQVFSLANKSSMGVYRIYNPIFMNLILQLLVRFQAPQTRIGKSLRDAFLAGFAAAFTVLADANLNPILTSVAMFLLSQTNRMTRTDGPKTDA